MPFPGEPRPDLDRAGLVFVPLSFYLSHVSPRSLRAWWVAVWLAYAVILVATATRLALAATVDHAVGRVAVAACCVLAAVAVRRRSFRERSLSARCRALIAVWLLGLAAAAVAASSAGTGARATVILGTLSSGLLLALTPPKALGGEF